MSKRKKEYDPKALYQAPADRSTRATQAGGCMTKNASTENMPKEPSLLEALEAGYLLALQIPHTSLLRAKSQTTLAMMRDAISAASGLDAEVVQNEFEEQAMRIALYDAAMEYMRKMTEA